MRDAEANDFEQPHSSPGRKDGEAPPQDRPAGLQDPPLPGARPDRAGHIGAWRRAQHHDDGVAHSDGVHAVPHRLRDCRRQSQLRPDPAQQGMRHQPADDRAHRSGGRCRQQLRCGSRQVREVQAHACAGGVCKSAADRRMPRQLRMPAGGWPHDLEVQLLHLRGGEGAGRGLAEASRDASLHRGRRVHGRRKVISRRSQFRPGML